MQSVINTMKGTALGVAEYLTPVLKVSASMNGIINYYFYFKNFIKTSTSNPVCPKHIIY